MADLILLDLSEAKLAPREVSIIAPRHGSRAYEGARFNRLSGDWGTSNTSADIDLWGDLYSLRGRARRMEQNDPYASKYLKLLQKNVIGPFGVRFQAKVPKKKGAGFNDKLNKQLETLWKRWCKKGSFSVDGRHSYASGSRFAARQFARDGECFVRLRTYNNAFNFAVQFLDPDQLDTNFFLYKMQNGNEIRMGVEVDPDGRPVAYHFWNRHPSEYSMSPLQRIRIPAAEVIHLYDPYRVMQTRGASTMGPSLIASRHLQKYTEAELVAARTAASKMGFFINKPGADVEYTGEMDPEKRVKMQAQPGEMEQLDPGLEFQPWDPQHPTAAFPAFIESQIRGIGAGWDVAYETLANNRKSVNYSSIRAGLLDERDTYKILQQWFIESFCQPIFEAWLEKTWLSGLIDLGSGLPVDYFDFAKWSPRGFPWVDPLKDQQADVLAVQNGFESQTAIMAEDGNDFEETMLLRKYEQDFIRDNDIEIGTDTKGMADTASDDEKDNPDTEEDGKSASGEK